MNHPVLSHPVLWIMFFESEFLDFLVSQESAGDDIPIMLLGNKTDKEMERQVQKEMGERLAKVCSVVSAKLVGLSSQNSFSPIKPKN